MIKGIFLVIFATFALSQATYKHYAYAQGPNYIYNQELSDPHFLRRYIIPFFGKGYNSFMPYYTMSQGSSKKHTTTVETSSKDSGKTATTSVKEEHHLPFIGKGNAHHNYAVYNVRNSHPSKKYVQHMPPPPKPITIVNVKNKHPPPVPPKQPQQPITILNVKNHHQAPAIPADPQHINIMNIDKDIPAPMGPPQLPANVRIMNVDDGTEEMIPMIAEPQGEYIYEEGKGKTQQGIPHEEIYSRPSRSIHTPEDGDYTPIPLNLSFANNEITSENAGSDGWERVDVAVNPTTEMPLEEEIGEAHQVNNSEEISEYEANQTLVGDENVYDVKEPLVIAVEGAQEEEEAVDEETMAQE